MITINETNLLDFIHSYFSSIGLQDEATSFFTSDNFSSALILSLSEVCLLPMNKSENSKSKQTHIHVTGPNRYFFYNHDEIDDITESSADRRQNVQLSAANIDALSKRDTPSTSYEDLGTISSFTLTKVAYRKNQDSQVQISKTRFDDSNFIKLRENLFQHDALIFLKYSDSDTYYVIAVPFQFYNGEYSFESTVLSPLQSFGRITVKSALSEAKENFSENTIISTSSDINDSIYQQLVDAAEGTKETYLPEVYVPSNLDGKSVTTKRPTTNPSLGKTAIIISNYECSLNSNHETFLKPDNTVYMEVHHLIPLEKQSLYNNKLDTLANLVPLCPCCHRLLHHGRKEDIYPLLETLLNERLDLLQQSGLDIDLKTLQSYY